MKDHVFATAGMTATTFDHPAYNSPTFSPGYRGGLINGLRPSLVVDTRFKMPASGIISTVNDLARFAIAIFERKLVTETTATEMFDIRPDGEGRVVFTAGWSLDSTGLSKGGKSPYGQALISTDRWRARRPISILFLAGNMPSRCSRIANEASSRSNRSFLKSAAWCWRHND
jgi:CubicO group peptidase (beta-lactamase class C family)